MKQAIFQDKPLVEADSPVSWRKWLAHHHADDTGIWLRIFNKKSEIKTVLYDEAVDEALCYGWIDSSIRKYDDVSYVQYFSPRSPKSNWSKVNKRKIAELLKAKKMAKPGLDLVKFAQETGTWDALNDVDNLIIPADLLLLLKLRVGALENFENFAPSVRRGILEWIFNAKCDETRIRRITETADKAAQNMAANQYQRKA